MQPEEEEEEVDAEMSIEQKRRKAALRNFSPLVGKLPNLATRLADRFKITRPNALQEGAFAPIQGGSHVVMTAPTGYGKTIAYALPLLANVNPLRAEPQVLVLCPSRELVVQTFEVLADLAGRGKRNKKGNGIVVKKFVGRGWGYSHSRGLHASVASAPHVVVATPRMAHKLHAQRLIEAHAFRHVVIDEADHILASEEHRGYVDKLFRAANRRSDLQFVFLSATTPPELAAQEAGGSLAFLPRRARLAHVRVDAGDESKQAVVHAFAMVRGADTTTALPSLFRAHARVTGRKRRERRTAAAFCASAATARASERALEAAAVPAVAMHPQAYEDREKRERARVLKAVNDRGVRACVATDMLARGMDMPGLTHVINVDLPASAEAYTHRAGRVGRLRDSEKGFAFTKGVVVTLVRSEEEQEQVRKYVEDLGHVLVPFDPATMAV